MRSAGELKSRIAIAGRIIAQLEEDPDISTDPRAADAIAHYVKQREKLVEELASIKPPPIVIGLQAARLTGTSK